jgi:hypothetical protein
MKDRAHTPQQKEEVIKRLLVAWKCKPELRLGQLLLCAMHEANNDYDPFYIEDYELVRNTEEFIKR